MPQNKKYIIIERRSRVAELYLKGTPQFKIAETLGFSQSQISRDLKVLSKQWQQSALNNIDEIKARELAKIDQAEREYWSAWERSCKIKVKKRFSKSELDKGSKSESSIEKMKMIGDPRFVDGVLKCIKQRAEILGLEAARKYKADIDLNALTDYQLDEIIQEVLNRIDNEQV